MLPSLVMVANPTVNYMLYEVLLARLAELKRRRRGIPTGGFQFPHRPVHLKAVKLG